MRSINKFYLKNEVLSAIKSAFASKRMVALKDFANATTDGKWTQKYVPDKYCFESHAPIPLQKEIAAFAREVTGKSPLDEGVRRFSHGSYTILHDREIQKPGVLALLFLDEWKEEWGGKIVLMKDGHTITSFIPQKNTLLLLERKKGERYFVKYVNNKARAKLRIVSG